MSTYINGDGGHLPPGAPSLPPVNLFAGYGGLTPAQKDAWRAAICPRHFVVPVTSTVTICTDAMPGDTASAADYTGYLFLLTASDPTVNTNWINLLTGSTAT